MNFPTEIWYNVFSFLTQRSMSKFSCLLNLYNLDIEEIQLLHDSNNLWFDANTKKYKKLIEFLIKIRCMDIDAKDKEGYTILYILSQYYDIYHEIIELLLLLGANINIQNGGIQQTILHYVCMTQNEKNIKFLIQKGANSNIKDLLGRTPLFWACGNKELFEYLVDNGADTSIRNYSNETPLELHKILLSLPKHDPPLLLQDQN